MTDGLPLCKKEFKKLSTLLAATYLCSRWRWSQNIIKFFQIRVDSEPPLTIIVYAMSNLHIETLTPLVRKQFLASGYEDVHQWAKARMNEIWYQVALGDLKVETANDLETAIANVRYEIGGGW
jgi:hypothetical protein